MGQFILKRLLASLPLLLGITLVCFAVIQLAPGDPLQLATELDPNASANAAMAAHYGQDKPLHTQYLNWLGGLLRGDLGTSLAPDGLPVAEKIMQALPITLWLNGVGLVLVLLLAVPLALAMAKRPGGIFDTTTTLLLYLGLAMPGFALALVGMQLFGVHLGWLPLAGMGSFGAENWPWWQRVPDLLWHLTLPLAVGLVGSLAGITRFLRGSLIQAMAADYVLTARAKGASPARVQAHALRNALLPVITILGLSVPGLLGGSVILESLFGLPGLGQLFYTASLMRDYPTLMGLLTIGAALTLLGNVLADVAYALADPRIRT